MKSEFKTDAKRLPCEWRHSLSIRFLFTTYSRFILPYGIFLIPVLYALFLSGYTMVIVSLLASNVAPLSDEMTLPGGVFINRPPN